MPPDMRKVYSSHIAAIGYDEGAQEFHVTFANGKTGFYAGVPPEVAARVNGAASIGSALHEHLKKPGFAFQYIGE